MKTFHLLFLAGLLVAGLAPQAQAQTQFGVRGGLNVAELTGTGVGETDPRLGLLAGVYATFPITRALAVQPELLYSQQGADFDLEANQRGSYQLNYLNIPVLLSYTVPTGTGLTPKLYAGPQVSFKLNESVRAAGVTVDGDDVRATDFGVAFGGDIGVRRVGAPSEFGVGLRYTLGLTDIFEDDPLFDPNVRNNVLSVTAYFSF